MQQTDKKTSVGSKMVKIVVPVLILALGAGAAAYFKATKPTARKAAPKAHVPLVEVMTASRGAARTTVQAMGTVVPSREIVLRAQVSGTVTALSPEFEPGGIIRKDKEILRIDRSDYLIALRRKESAVAEAKADLRLEQGSQEVARQELEYMKKTAPEAVKDASLALREPQLAQARAKLAEAEADLEQARLDLARTTIRAPFNALVTERNVNLGSHADTQSELARLVSTDEYWIEAAVPLDRLKNVDFAHPGGCPVRVTSPASGGEWFGRVARLTGTLTDNTRMGKLLVAVKDPLGLAENRGHEPLMLGDYVTVEIAGRNIADVITLPRAALRDNGTVWVVSGGSLEIRPVQTAWKDAEKVFIASGLASGEQVVLSDITAPVDGMPLKASLPKEAPSVASANGKHEVRN